MKTETPDNKRLCLNYRQEKLEKEEGKAELFVSL